MKDKKGLAKGIAKVSMLVLVTALLGVFLVNYAIPALADTHSSVVTVTPHIVPPGAHIKFVAHVECTGGPDPIHEFRVYEPIEFSGLDCDSVTGWYDPFYAFTTISGVEYEYCQWNAKTGNELYTTDTEDFTFYLNTAETECCRDLFVETRDDHGYYEFHNPQACVDKSDPITTKGFIGPWKIDGSGVEWIDGVTLVELTAVDPIPHPAGVKETFYKNKWLACGQSQCENPGSCTVSETPQNPLDPISEGWTKYTGPFPKEEECCHKLLFYSIDNVDNVEDVQANCFYVDKTPPEVDKEVGTPKIEELDLEELGNGKAGWVTSEFYSGDSSAKLVMPESPAVEDYAGVDSFFDVFVDLDGVTSLSYYRKLTEIGNQAWTPLVILGIDADGDGVFEAQPLEWEIGAIPRNPALLGDDTFIQCEHPTGQLFALDPDFVLVDAYNDFVCYTPTADGKGWIGYQPLSYYQSNAVGKVEPTDKVAMVKVMLNVPAADGEIVYVDYVEMNNNIIINEPDGFTWVTSGTDITFTCTDQPPHPSGGEELCFKVSYDQPSYPTYITSGYCTNYGGTMDEDWCCISAMPASPFVFEFDEDSFHDLEYYCRDAVEKESDVYIQYYKVDTTPPEITKTMIGTDHLGDCPPTSPNDECYVRDDGENGVRIDVVDGGNICAVNEVICAYQLWWEYDIVDSGEFGEEGVDIYFTEDSTHTLRVNCEDALGNEMVEDVEVFLVDSTPPVTTKTYGDPHYPEVIVDPYMHWINSSTPITLTATDAKVGVDKIYWRNTVVDNSYCESAGSGCSYAEGSGDFVEYTGPFYKPEESCHLIEFYAVDKLGNEETQNKQCVYVDNTPPTVGKSLGEPKETIGNDIYITNNTPITLSCIDLGDHPVDHVNIWYRYRISDDCQTWGDWTTDGCADQVVDGWCDCYQTEKIIKLPQDSCHELEYYCEDALGNEGAHQFEIDIVDNQPPVIEKTIVGPSHGDCPPEQGQDCYIDGITEIHVNVEDPIPHPVEGVTCDWDYEVTDGDKEGEGQSGLTPPFDIQFPEESTHILTITCRDALGNEVTDVETFYVDKTPPETTKWYEGPQYSDGLPEYSFQTFSQDIEGSDYNLEVTIEDDGTWIIWNFDFPVETFTGDGNLNVGLIIATDGEGNGPAFQIHNNDGADSSHAWGTWLMSPWGPTIGDGWNGWHSGDTNTPVTSLSWVEATGNRNVPHGDGILQVKILKSELGESFHWAASPTVGSGFWDAYDVTMQIPTAFDWSTPIVDMGVPNYEYAEGVGGYPKWITSETQVWLSAHDEAGPHDSGVAATWYRDVYLPDPEDWDYCYEACANWENDERYSAYGLPTAPEPYNPKSVDPSWEEWTGEPFYKSPESCHIIEYYSIDGVDKVERPEWQCVFVDNTVPTPVKTVGDPKDEWHPGEEGDPESYFYPEAYDNCWNGEGWKCWEVTQLTPISLGCEDLGPHPVDHEEVCFKVELDGIDATEDYCGEYDGGMTDDGFCCAEHTIEEFYFREDTEHELEYYCVDALGNTNKEDLDIEKFKVEGNMFEIPLFKKWNLVSVPFVLLNDDPEEVFKDMEGVEEVWAYDGDTEQWYVYTPDGIDNDNLESIVPGWGYWVLESEAEEWLTIGGSLFSPRTVPPSRGLVKGWNLIGYYGSSWELYDWSDFDFVCGDAFNFPDKYIYGDKVYCALNSLIDTQEGYPRWSSLWSHLNCGDHQTAWLGLNACADQSYQQMLDRMYAGRGYWIELDVEDQYAPATTCIWNDGFECRWTGGGVLP